MAGIGVILNPHSKLYKKNPQKTEQLSLLIGDKAIFKLTHDLDDLHHVIEDFKKRQIDTIAILGGDGTIHCTLTVLLNVYASHELPKITFLRGGTLNNIANCLGIVGTTEKILSNLLSRYHGSGGQEKKLPLLNINGQFGCVFGMGVIYRFMEQYYRYKKLNKFVAAQTVLKNIFSLMINGKSSRHLLEPFEASVEVDGQSWPFQTYNAVFAASIEQMGLNFNLFYHMKNQNEKFHVYGMSLEKPRTLLRYLWHLRFGKPIPHKNILDKAAVSLKITLPTPQAYTIDGDLMEPKTFLEIHKGPSLTVLC